MAEQTKAVATQDMSTEVQTYEDRPVSDFNPNEHLIQIPSKDGKKDYLPVQWRLVWFRLMCPQGTIDTEELEVDNDRECEAEISAWNAETRRSEKVIKKALGYARYRAVVTDGKGGRASATKTERMVDFPDFVEKAETGAVGRALAMLGYGTQFAMIEFDEGERVVDAPVERKPAKSYQERRPFVEADKPKDQALHDLGKPGSYEQHEAATQPQANEQEPPTLTLGKLFVMGKERGMWSDTSVAKFYSLASAVLGGIPINGKSKPDQSQLLQVQAAIEQEVFTSAGAGK